MREQEFEITRNIFGGYNRKKTLAYIEELQKLVEETQIAREKLEREKAGSKKKLADAEKCYTALWERSRGLEETIKAQKETINQQKDIMTGQKNDINSLKERAKQQEQNLEQALKKLAQDPADEIEKVIKKQVKTLKKKCMKKGEN